MLTLVCLDWIKSRTSQVPSKNSFTEMRKNARAPGKTLVVQLLCNLSRDKIIDLPVDLTCRTYVTVMPKL